MNNELGSMSEEVVVAHFNYYSSVCIEGAKKARNVCRIASLGARFEPESSGSGSAINYNDTSGGANFF
jgi:hypothetical protein